jgi:succinate dehydrogenase / fumarate reductase cytochrome b subunit
MKWLIIYFEGEDMTGLMGFLTTTLGRKYIVALTGFGWYVFVLTHMLGNMLILKGAEAYNLYGHMIVHNPFIKIMELLLATLLLLHVIVALSLKIRNWRTKPISYVVKTNTLKRAPYSSRTMIYTGLFILGFIIFHLITFKWGPHYTVTYNGLEVRDLYTLIVEKFTDPYYCFGYFISMIFIGLHLFHGVKSSFQTVGIHHPRYQNLIKGFGYVYAITVAVGFMIQPIYVYFMR